MYGIVDRLLLFGCCFIVLFWQSQDLYAVWAMLVIVTISAVNGLYRSRIFLLTSVFLYSVGALIWQNFVFFLPLIIYEVLEIQQETLDRRWFFVCLVPLVVMVLRLPIPFFALFCLLVIVAYILLMRGTVLQRNQRELNNLRDDGWELTLTLQERNRELLEKQDYGLRMAKLNERSRIAREIHDHVGHLLSRSILQVGALAVVEQDQEVSQSLDLVRDTLTEAMDRIRASVHDLYDESLDLRIQVQSLVSGFDFCPIRFDYKLEDNLDKDVENCFLAVIKEGLNNIARHSNATKVTLTLVEHPSLYQLILQDNGTNFKSEGEKGLGLRSMNDRVESLQGRFMLEYAGGFRLFISIPKGRTSHENINY